MVTDDLLVRAAMLLAPARLLLAAWVLLSAGHWLATGRSPAPWGRGSALPPRRVRLIFAGEAVLAAAMIVLGSSSAALAACLLLFLLGHGALLWTTGGFWADGAEKMGMIAAAGTLGMALGVAWRDPALALAGALLAGGQLALCYATAGFSKLPVRGWRDGSELATVMASRAFGHPGLAGVLRRRPALGIAASWAVIVAEAGFPLALFAPQPWLLAALGLLFAFHLGTALFMGLNKFPWAYAAAYPAALLLGDALRGMAA